ncbi:MAG TPA: peptide chain release factor 1 [Anaerolineae bacterium]|nr:peptide chain release factor 1 [Anaerolineae bacterium]
MLEKLEAAEKRYEELNRLMANPEVATDPARLRKYAQERADLEDLVGKYREYKATTEELEATRAMLDEGHDEEMAELIREEIEALQERRDGLLEEIKLLLLPQDPRDRKDVIVEIRAGTGGEEAALFAADLYRMYAKYAEKHGWRTEVLSAHPTGIGGFKEIVFEVKGPGAYSHLKYESGVHRVQRVPITESSGRIHTSTATVAVLPEMEEIEVKIDPNDLRIDVYGASGPGGQHMQKNATAVRITHLPTGLVVACESERSQFQNRARAMAILRAKLYEMEEQKRLAEVGAVRRAQVGTGERAEKIRTYNFPQNRVTDHRINKTSYQLGDVLEGELDEFIEELAAADRAEKLQVIGEEAKA